MTDAKKRKKVIRGLMVCSDDIYKCIDCPYYSEYTGNTDCSNHLCKDALALLKEQGDPFMNGGWLEGQLAQGRQHLR